MSEKNFRGKQGCILAHVLLFKFFSIKWKIKYLCTHTKCLQHIKRIKHRKNIFHKFPVMPAMKIRLYNNYCIFIESDENRFMLNI